MKILITTLSITSLVIAVTAQDIHFSQFWASPLNLNPAQTGAFDGTYRATGIYRDQWASVNSPYKTFSLSYDHIFNSPILAEDQVAAGLMLTNDVAGDAKFSNLSILVSGAYHKSLSAVSTLTLGIQTGLFQKKLDREKLRFGNMFNNNSQEFSLPLNDPLAGDPNLSNLDFTMGLQYSHLINNKFATQIGIAGMHILTPKESFDESSDNELPMRLAINGGVSFPLNAKMSLGPKFIYMGQAKAKEFSLGTDLGYKLQNPKYEATVYGGLWARLSGKDAVVPYVGLGYKDFRFGLSYDVNISGLKEVSHGKGAFEVSLIYIGRLTMAPTVIVPPCLRF